MGFRALELKGSYFPADRPLDSFYVKALSSAVSYDRVAGYFRSTALAAAAPGISRFIENDGKMRMIVGAELRAEDVNAVLDGEGLAEVVARRVAAEPLSVADAIAEHRLAALAWLVQQGRLEIRVGVPVDGLGRPLSRENSYGYFHAKLGLLTDSDGDRLAFSGSVNESATAWRHNLEQLHVFRSWDDGAWPAYGQVIADKINDYWNGSPEPGWAILELPDAARQELLKHAPPPDKPPPAADPAERSADAEAQAARDRALLGYVRAAPRLDGGTGVGIATAGVEPFPHQRGIAARALATYPRGYLLADEVGLGKTIEAGLIIRELMLSGRAESCLMLVPASVLKQWQQELVEKLSLDVPRYEGGEFLDADDNPVSGAKEGPPWAAFPIVLATSHLARRTQRRQEVLGSGPWDIVFVDEAHHARRRGHTDEPNALLRLLRDMKLAKSWKALYLASATPMQMEVHEAWDLLDLLGLQGRWGQSAEMFTRYYSELREEFDERDWALISRMAVDYRSDDEARTDTALEQLVKQELGSAGSRVVRRVGEQGITQAVAEGLSPAHRDLLNRWLRAHTPMRDRVFRTTRETLRQYKAADLIDKDINIPIRSVTDRFVPLTAQEARLYERIETYISRFYDAYREAQGQRRRALGFIMTVYRRRLTSSFRAVELSLRRRLDVLLEGGAASKLLDDDDYWALEGSIDEEAVTQTTATAEGLAEEVSELHSFLDELAQRPPNESKMEYLLDELKAAFAGPHDTVIVFTQYTDTMEYIRDQLTPQYQAGVGCYSGRGGELYDPKRGSWVPATKERVKRMFRSGEIKILVGTDSLSEGLNLQTCGWMVNYDMPWNFMRVEQRIGRIDRIGGRPTVNVFNYFYEGTVEEQIYKGIAEDFEWFEDVVGPAQPVLSQVESAIEEVALRSPGAEREALLEERLAAIRGQIAQARERPVGLEDMTTSGLPTDGGEAAIDLGLLARALTIVPATADCLAPHPDIEGAYLLSTGDFAEVPVTLRRDVLAEHSPTVRLLTYGAPELEAVLGAAEETLQGLAGVGATVAPPETRTAFCQLLDSPNQG